MICKTCGKNFQFPLYSFNGTPVCPHCKKEVLTLAVSKENEEYYNLSQIAFLRYLSPKSANRTVGEKLKPIEALKKAQRYCQISASLGNPFAILQMGYLLEKFRSENKNELERIRLAIVYYRTLCYCEEEAVATEKGANEISQEQFTALKIEAGKRFLKICSKYSSLLKTLPQDDYKRNKERLNAKYSTAYFEDAESSQNTPFNKVEAVVNILTSSRSKAKAPLFGVFLLNANQYKALFETNGNESTSAVAKLIKKDPDFLRYMLCDKSGRVKDDNARVFSRLASVERATSVADNLTEDSFLYLYFFNMYGKHPYLNKKQMQTVKRELENDDYALLLSLVNYVSEDSAVFFDDDIEQFKTNKHASGAVTKLIESICAIN